MTCKLLWVGACFAVMGLVAGGLAEEKPAGKKYLLYVGTYTKSDSKGIYAYRYDAGTGKMESLGLAAASVNPSFVIADTAGRFLFAVNETGDYQGKSSGGVTSFRIDQPTGRLTPINEVASLGADPCYVSLDKTGKYLLVANYTGGSVAVFPIASDGRLGQSSAFVQHKGSSVNPQRQEAAHAHWIETTSDNRFAVAVDLGMDEVVVYRFDQNKGTLTPNQPPFVKAEPGSGPRHLAWSADGKFAYVVNELGSSVTQYSYDSAKGAFTRMGTVSSVPKSYTGENDGAEIHISRDGRFVYVSNRGSNTIAVFSVEPGTGKLTLQETVPSGGKMPRNFEFDPTGTRLLVAHQDSNNVVVFAVDPSTGHLKPTGEELKVSMPVSLRFVEIGN